MTIDEAIARERQLAKEQRSHIGTFYSKIMGYDDEYIKKCEVCAEEHEQLAEWLEELKFIRQWKSDVMDEFCKYDVNSFEELATNARNNAIDDFVKEVCKMIVQSENNGNYRFYAVEIKQTIADLAEQLKEGVDNETN